MRLSIVLSTALLFSSNALAQYPSMSTEAAKTSMMPAATPGSMVNVQVVQVSNKDGALKYTPNSLKAAVGSLVQFHFYPKNHSIVQSTFENPCVPINNIMPNVTGLFSGFMPVKDINSMMPIFTVAINDTKPIWFYCSQGKHCQAGMVGVINPPAAAPAKNIDAFAALAKKAPENLSPGQKGSGSMSMGATVSSGTTMTMGSGSNGTAPSMTAPPTTATGSSGAGGSGAGGSGAGSTTATASIAVQTKNAAGRLGAGSKEVVLGGAAGVLALVAFVGL